MHLILDAVENELSSNMQSTSPSLLLLLFLLLLDNLANFMNENLAEDRLGLLHVWLILMYIRGNNTRTPTYPKWKCKERMEKMMLLATL